MWRKECDRNLVRDIRGRESIKDSINAGESLVDYNISHGLAPLVVRVLCSSADGGLDLGAENELNRELLIPDKSRAREALIASEAERER
eukprot:g42098.t1